jgi:putative transposase
MEVGSARLGDGEGANGGDLTGPNPTDRAKRGVKRHLLTDGRGVPLAAVLSAANVHDNANVHDKWTLAETLDSVVLRAGPWPRRPEHLCLDKGYCFRDCDAIVRARHIVPHIRRKGEPPLLGRVHGTPRRWVVERTGSWCNRFRALLIRWEVQAVNYLALFHLACALITLQHS